MEIIPVTILNPNGMRNGSFWVLATKKDSRKDTRNLPGRTGEPGSRSQVTEVRTSIQVFHL